MTFDKKIIKTFPSDLTSSLSKLSVLFGFTGIMLYNSSYDISSGYLGSNPLKIEDYLNAYSIKHETLTSVSEMDRVKRPGVYIFSCWNNASDIKGGLHTFAVQVDKNGSLKTFNGYDDVNPYKSFSEILTYQKQHSFITGYCVY